MPMIISFLAGVAVGVIAVFVVTWEGEEATTDYFHEEQEDLKNA